EADRGDNHFLFCAAFPLSRGLEERSAPGSGRAHRPTSQSLRFKFAHQGQGPGRECRSGVLRTGDVPALPGPGAGLGRTLLRGRAFLSLLRPPPPAVRLGRQAPSGGEGASRRLSPRRSGTSSVLLPPPPQ